MVIQIDQIKNIVSAYFKDKPVKRAFLFGSYAAGKANDDSDIDLLVRYDHGKKVSLFDVIRLKIDLEKLLEKQVDLVEEGFLYSGFKPAAGAEKIKLYEA